jgi:hypothetical protein
MWLLIEYPRPGKPFPVFEPVTFGSRPVFCGVMIEKFDCFKGCGSLLQKINPDVCLVRGALASKAS